MRTIKTSFAPLMTKEQYYKAKEDGKCVRCLGRDALPGKVMCEVCANKGKKYREETRKWLKKVGYCPRCGRNKLYGEEKTCPECLANAAIANKKYRQKHYGSDHEYYVMDIARLKEKGLCRGCRKNEVAEGHTYCLTCLIKKRKRTRLNHQYDFNDFIPRVERRSYGLCYRCGSPLDTDKNACSKCCKELVKNFKGKRGANSYWRFDNQFLTGGYARG